MFSFKTYACPELPVELPDGRTLHLIPAAKGLVDKIQHVERTVEGIYGMCAEILSANRDKLDGLTDLLLEQETIDRSAFMAFMDGEKVEESESVQEETEEQTEV